MVKARPIIFSAPMVQAILAGRKMQTRRVMKPQPNVGFRIGDCHWVESGFSLWSDNGGCGCIEIKCPYGTVGDVLWVRESLENANDGALGYPVDGTWFPNTPWMWKKNKLPSIYMPRWASRITLEITEIRVERLQDISEQDAIAEGVQNTIYWKEEHPPSICYSVLWEAINGKGSWNANPWVWVVEFTPHIMNVDDYLSKLNVQGGE